MNTLPTHYEILSLPQPLQNEPLLPATTLRHFYKKALLLHHPDKANPMALNRQSVPYLSKPPYTIDQITTAYTTLSNPSLRAKYDASLLLQQNSHLSSPSHQDTRNFHTGIETVDLDDLRIDLDLEEEGGEKGQVWYKGCRCGDDRGFEVREGELESAAEAGEKEVLVGCRGCSLWLRVLFGVLEEGEGGEDCKD